MKREQFLRLLRVEARARGETLKVVRSEGKGSHYRVYFGGKRTIIQSGELSPSMVRTIRKQLGLDC